MAAGLGLVDDDRVEQTLATDCRDHRILLLDIPETLTEDLTKTLRTLYKLLLLNDLKRLDGDC